MVLAAVFLFEDHSSKRKCSKLILGATSY